VLDAAHNAASIEALVQVLEESFSVRRRLLIFATTQDKDLRGMLEQLLGRFDEVIFTRYLNNPRGVPPEELQTLANELKGWGGSSTAAPTISPLPLAGEGPGVRAVETRIAATSADAWDLVHRLAGPDDLICITGSFFLASEMRRQITARPLAESL
jgi:dihydrofolate synthase / folylpolyglutamate synthase